MSGKKSTHVSEEKKKIVRELSDLIKNKRTILIASIKDIPGSQFQEIVKKLRGKVIVKVPKKNLIFRAIDDSGQEAEKKLKEQITESVAILFSDLDSFDLAAELINNKSPTKAKAGQEAPTDIEIPAGPTDLVPGPAISELGALGIQIKIEKGKITIKEPKIIAKEGEKISAGAAELMNKLNIRPFSIGFIPLSAFDTKEGKLYSEIKIDREETLNELKAAFGKALPFAVEIGYPAKDTISFLLGKAGRHGKVIEGLKKEEPKQEKPKEEKTEDYTQKENLGENK
jgi:large subunit ribosomal protein L10